MESKNPNEVVLKKLEHLRFDCHHLVPPTGHGAGGLVLFWKQELNLQILDSNANEIEAIIEYEGKRFTPYLYMAALIGTRETYFGTNWSRKVWSEMSLGS